VRRWTLSSATDPRECYNIAGGNEMTNREITDLILELTGAPASLVQPVEDRKAMTGGTRSPGPSSPPGLDLARGFRRSSPPPWHGTASGATGGADQSGAFREYYARQYGPSGANARSMARRPVAMRRCARHRAGRRAGTRLYPSPAC